MIHSEGIGLSLQDVPACLTSNLLKCFGKREEAGGLSGERSLSSEGCLLTLRSSCPSWECEADGEGNPAGTPPSKTGVIKGRRLAPTAESHRRHQLEAETPPVFTEASAFYQGHQRTTN